MGWTVHQSESAIDTAGAMTVTLGGATTNGRYLVALYGAVQNGQAQSVTGWNEILDQACTTSGAGGWAWAGWKEITANENSITMTGVNGTGNQVACIFEVSASNGILQVTGSTVTDPSGTGTTAALGPVTAVNGDLVMAIAFLRDDDSTDFSWSNSFANGPAYRETASGTPQMASEAAYIISTGGSVSTTATFTGASADIRHGFMLVLHELQAHVKAAGIGNTIAASAGVAAEG